MSFGISFGLAKTASTAQYILVLFTLQIWNSVCCRNMGLNSLPVAFGPEKAKWITVGTIDITQIAVAAYLAFGRHETTYAAVLAALILPQVRLFVLVVHRPMHAP